MKMGSGSASPLAGIQAMAKVILRPLGRARFSGTDSVLHWASIVCTPKPGARVHGENANVPSRRIGVAAGVVAVAVVW